MKLIDAHCHLQDPRILPKAAQLIREARESSAVVGFVVNGVRENDWEVVKQLGEQHLHPSVIPCFGIHPWFAADTSPNWFDSLRHFFFSTPSAAVGEIGLDKGSRGSRVDFALQVDVFRRQLELAKEMRRPVSVHCVRAYGDLLQILKSTGPFPAGVILHSYLGSAEMVPELAKLGSCFSFSGFLMSMKPQKAKRMLKMVPSDRILLETDAPDALPKAVTSSLFLVEGDPSIQKELQIQLPNSDPNTETLANNIAMTEVNSSSLPKETLNHPANISVVLDYAASLLEMNKDDLAELSYRNAVRLFSYDGSKILLGE